MLKPITVATPRFWWRMAAEDARRWVSADPDVEDGRQRHTDRDAQRWPLIAAVVTQVGNALAASAWAVDPDFEDRGFVELDGYPSDLTQTEHSIVSAWFRASEAVQFDPWFEPLTNRRHRLWATMPYFGAARIPIRGDALGYANTADTEVLGANWSRLYAANLDELDALDWFDTDDPVNARFRSPVAAAAAGDFPASIAPPGEAFFTELHGHARSRSNRERREPE